VIAVRRDLAGSRGAVRPTRGLDRARLLVRVLQALGPADPRANRATEQRRAALGGRVAAAWPYRRCRRTLAHADCVKPGEMTPLSVGDAIGAIRA